MPRRYDKNGKLMNPPTRSGRTTGKGGGGMLKRYAPPPYVCPVTRSEFVDSVAPMALRIADKDFELPMKMFATGSLGWFAHDRASFPVGDTQCECIVQVMVIISNSRDVL